MDPDEIRRLFAQQDATRPSTAREGQANPLALLAETGVDFTPIVGDLKALLLDAPESFRGGHPVLGTVDALSAVPLLGLPFDFLRKGMRAVREVTGAAVDSAIRFGDRQVGDVLSEAFAGSTSGRIVRGEAEMMARLSGTPGPEARSIAREEAELLAEIRADIRSGATPPTQDVINQSEALAARRAARVPATAGEELSALQTKFTRGIKAALARGDSEGATRLTKQMIEARERGFASSPLGLSGRAEARLTDEVIDTGEGFSVGRFDLTDPLGNPVPGDAIVEFLPESSDFPAALIADVGRLKPGGGVDTDLSRMLGSRGVRDVGRDIFEAFDAIGLRANAIEGVRTTGARVGKAADRTSDANLVIPREFFFRNKKP